MSHLVVSVRVVAGWEPGFQHQVCLSRDWPTVITRGGIVPTLGLGLNTVAEMLVASYQSYYFTPGDGLAIFLWLHHVRAVILWFDPVTQHHFRPRFPRSYRTTLLLMPIPGVTLPREADITAKEYYRLQAPGQSPPGFEQPNVPH